MQETTCHTIPHVQTWGQGPVDPSLENDSTKAPVVGEAHKVFICSNSDRQDTEGQRRPAFNAPASGRLGRISDCSFKTKQPSGNTGYSRRTGNCSGLWGGCPSYGGEGIEVPSRQHGRLTLTTPDQGQGWWEVSPPSHLPPDPPEAPAQPHGRACCTHEVESWPWDAPTCVRSPAPRAAAFPGQRLSSRGQTSASLWCHARAGLTPARALPGSL